VMTEKQQEELRSAHLAPRAAQLALRLEIECLMSEWERDGRLSQNENLRLPPLPHSYHATRRNGNCRWCGGLINREDGTMDKRRRWHPACLAQYMLWGFWPKTMNIVRRRDKCCVLCGGPGEEVDHIEPIWRSGNLVSTHFLANLRLLCLECHKQKTRADGAERRAERRSVALPLFT
jgi:hypothetical protein